MQRGNPWSLLMQQRFQHTEGQKSEVKQAASQGPQTTAQRWYQPKRIPLYIAVAGGLLGAATFFWTKQATHPQVETSKHIRCSHPSLSSNYSRVFSCHTNAGFCLFLGARDGSVPKSRITDSRLSIARRLPVKSLLANLSSTYLCRLLPPRCSASGSDSSHFALQSA